MRFIKYSLVFFLTTFVAITTAEAVGTRTRYVNTASSAGGNGTTNLTSGANRAYSSLANALTNEAVNLVTADVILDVLCEGSAADTAAPSFTGFTTDATRYIRIRGNDTAGGAHVGIYSTSKYRLAYAADGPVLDLTANDVHVENIQIINTGDNSNPRRGVKLSGSGQYYILGNLVIYKPSGTPNTGDTHIGIYANGFATFSTATIVNNIAYNWPGPCIGLIDDGATNPSMFVYNNTAYGCSTGANTNGCMEISLGASGDTFKARDNVLQSCGGSDYQQIGSGTIVTAKNVTLDASSPDGATYQNKTVTFVNTSAGSEDLHLDVTDTVAKDAGDDLSADSDYSFNVDVDRSVRPFNVIWDIGADEYGATLPTTTTTTTSTSTSTSSTTSTSGTTTSTTTTTSTSSTSLTSSSTTTSTSTTSTTVIAVALREICGNGYDDLGTGGTAGSCPSGWMDAIYATGCDKKCPTPEQDGDGYATDGSGNHAGTDCDDTKKDIYPGVITTSGCTLGWTRTCNSNGSYTSCVAPAVCEKIGGGSCYYISFQFGSDTTGTGTYANPWKTAKCVGFWTSGAPACHVNLGPDDAVYFKDGGTYTTTYQSGIDNGGPTIDPVIFALNAQSGTSSHKLLISRYPGATVTFNPACSVGSPCMFAYIKDSNYVKLRDLKFTGAAGQSALFGNGSSNLEFERVFIYGTDGAAANNVAALNLTGGNTYNFHHGNLYDNADSAVAAGDNENTADMVVFGGATTGKDVTITDSNFFWTNPIATSTWKHGRCFKFKHGTPQTVAQSFQFVNNKLWNCRGGLVEDTSGTRARRNVIADSELPYYWANQGGSTTCPVDNQFYFNTVLGAINISGGGIAYYKPETSASCPTFGAYSLMNNIFDTVTALASNEWNMFRLDSYGSNPNFTSVVTGGTITSNENCWFNHVTDITSDTNSFNMYGCSVALCGIGGTLGTFENFPGFQSTYSQEAAGFAEDALCATGTLLPTSTNCTTAGYLADDTPPSSTTTTTTTSTTTVSTTSSTTSTSTSSTTSTTGTTGTTTSTTTSTSTSSTTTTSTSSTTVTNVTHTTSTSITVTTVKRYPRGWWHG